MAESSANAIFVFSADNYNTTRDRLMGRQAATEGFLRGFVQHGGVDAYWCYALRRDDLETFRKRIAEFAGKERACAAVPPLDFGAWSKVGTLYRPGPNIGHFAWLRRAFGQRSYSICGVTHTTAEHVVMDGIAESLLGPVQPWDALVCTSTQVKAMVEYMVDQLTDFMLDRFGGKTTPQFNLPLIPLGVDCSALDPTSATAKRARTDIRKSLKIGEDEIAFLYVGRLTHVEKANPLAMYLALERAAKKTKRRLHLIHAGWFATGDIEKIFKTACQQFAPSVQHHFLDGRRAEVRNNVWFAGDVFTSLSDNIQETFGLTPIEAMAAGLPVVVSDWDGYRYTVRDGKDGITVPTFMPPAGDGGEIALRYASGMDGYGRYCMATAQSIAVDVEACADAYLQLAEDAALRRKYGDAGRKHASASFDWSVVIKAYQALWMDMAETRKNAEENAPPKTGRPARPLRDDPFALFESYPTAPIDGTTIIEPVSGADARQIQAFKGSPLANLMPSLILPDAGLAQLVERVRRNRATVEELVIEQHGVAAGTLRRSLGWLAKNGLVRLRPPEKKRRRS
ncbi:MAG: glycosyltransferase family 4 protein [Dongiaceae bacterium]